LVKERVFWWESFYRSLQISIKRPSVSRISKNWMSPPSLRDSGSSVKGDELAAARVDYRNRLTWTDKDNPKLGTQLEEIQRDSDLARFNKMFVELMKAPTPQALPESQLRKFQGRWRSSSCPTAPL
jgi:hypothetical protein